MVRPRTKNAKNAGRSRGPVLGRVVQPGTLVYVVGVMGRVSWTSCLALLVGCTVGDSGDPFPSVNSGSATATATAGSASTGGGSEGSGDGGTGSSAEAGSEDGSSSGGWSPGDPTTTTTSPGGSTGAEGDSSGGDSESSGGGEGACMGAPLDPQLAVPPSCEPTCTGIGFGNDCPGLGEYCRLRDSQTAVCESCDACGNLHDPCVTTADCDIIFTCFMGQCTAQCDLSTPQTCGNPAACTHVGHPTHGVCDPNL